MCWGMAKQLVAGKPINNLMCNLKQMFSARWLVRGTSRQIKLAL